MNYFNIGDMLNVNDADIRFKNVMDAFFGFKEAFAENIMSLQEDENCPSSYISKYVGLDVSYTRKCLTGVRWFPSCSLGRLAYSVLFRSCDSLFFARDNTITLSKASSLIAEKLLAETQREAASPSSEEKGALPCIRYINIAFNETEGANRLRTFSDELIKDRILEYSSDRYVSPIDITRCAYEDEISNKNLRLRLKKLFYSSEAQEVRLPLLFYLSVVLSVPLDYFIAPDYTRYCKIRLFGTSGKNGIISDPRIIDSIGKYLQLPPEPQSEKDMAASWPYKSQAEVFSYIMRTERTKFTIDELPQQ